MTGLVDNFAALDAAVLQLEALVDPKASPGLNSADVEAVSRLLTEEIPALEKRIRVVCDKRRSAVEESSAVLLHLCSRMEALDIDRSNHTKEKNPRNDVQELVTEFRESETASDYSKQSKESSKPNKSKRLMEKSMKNATTASGPPEQSTTAAVAVPADSIANMVAFEPVSKQMHQRLPRNLRVQATLDRLNKSFRALWDEMSPEEDCRRSTDQISEKLGPEIAELLPVLRGVGVVRQVGQPKPGWVLTARSRQPKKNLRTDMGNRR